MKSTIIIPILVILFEIILVVQATVVYPVIGFDIDNYYPSIAVFDSENEFAIVYCANGANGDGGGYGCFAQYMNETTLGVKRQLNNVTQYDQRWIASSKLNSTHQMYAYRNDQNQLSRITTQIEIGFIDKNTGNTNIDSNSVQVNANFPIRSNIACQGENGNCFVVYHIPSDSVMYGRMYTALGVPLAPQFTIKTPFVGSTVTPYSDTKSTSDGNFWIVWQACSGVCGIGGAIYTNQGAKLTEITINSYITNQCDRFPKALPLPNNRILVFWVQTMNPSCSGMSDVMFSGHLLARLYESNGTAVTPTLTLTFENIFVIREVAAVLVNDQVLFFYNRWNGYRYALYCQTFDPTTLSVGTSVLLTVDGYDMLRPVAFKTSNRIIVSVVERSFDSYYSLRTFAFEHQMSATNLNQIFNYTTANYASLRPIQITNPAISVNAWATFNVDIPSLGLVNSSVITGLSKIESSGMFTINGSIADMNQALANLRFHPTQNIGNVTIDFLITDELNNQVQGRIIGQCLNFTEYAITTENSNTMTSGMLLTTGSNTQVTTGTLLTTGANPGSTTGISPGSTTATLTTASSIATTANVAATTANSVVTTSYLTTSPPGSTTGNEGVNSEESTTNKGQSSNSVVIGATVSSAIAIALIIAAILVIAKLKNRDPQPSGRDQEEPSDNSSRKETVSLSTEVVSRI